MITEGFLEEVTIGWRPEINILGRVHNQCKCPEVRLREGASETVKGVGCEAEALRKASRRQY